MSFSTKNNPQPAAVNSVAITAITMPYEQLHSPFPNALRMGGAKADPENDYHYKNGSASRPHDWIAHAARLRITNAAGCSHSLANEVLQLLDSPGASDDVTSPLPQGFHTDSEIRPQEGPLTS